MACFGFVFCLDIWVSNFFVLFFFNVCVFPFFVFCLLFRESKQVQLGGYGSGEDQGDIGEGGKA